MTSPRFAAATLAALALTLGACSGSEDEPTATATSPDAPVLQPGKPGEPNKSLTGTSAVATPTKSHNDADVEFHQDMIVHHSQAIVMGDITKGRLADKQVRAIAERISAEQKPEMDGMARTLKSWKEKVPPQAANPTFGVRDGHSSHQGMPGMATPEQLKELDKASGVKLDRLYLDLMIKHHKGALEMCLDQAREGTDTRTGELASDISVTQTKQIGQMTQMRERL